MEAFDNTVRDYTTWLDNPYVSGALTIFLIVYASMAAPKLPPYVAKLFDYTLFKLLMFFLIVYISKKNATVALVAAVALMVSIMTLDRLKVGAEMMTIVNGGNGKKVKFGNCSCNCDDVDLEDVDVAQTQEGKMVVAEAKLAVAQGVLHPSVASEIIQKVVAKEAEGKPVLTSSTQEGAKRMIAVSKAQTAGTLSELDAKQVAAKIVVHEAVMRSKVEESPMGEQSKYAKMTDGELITSGINALRPNSADGSAVHDEILKAYGDGTIGADTTAKLILNNSAKISQGKPILVASTQEGAQRMANVVKAKNSGSLTAEEARRLAAKIVVNEAIVNAKAEGKSEDLPNLAETKKNVPAQFNVSGNSVSENVKLAENELGGLDLSESSHASADHH